MISRWKIWWRCPGLNGGPAAYESAALPTELHRQGRKINDLRCHSQGHYLTRCLTLCHQPSALCVVQIGERSVHDSHAHDPVHSTHEVSRGGQAPFSYV